MLCHNCPTRERSMCCSMRTVEECPQYKYLANSMRVLTATQQLDLGTVTTIEFLLQTAYSVETYIRRQINWNHNVWSLRYW